jgi:hypothetical protein
LYLIAIPYNVSPVWMICLKGVGVGINGCVV